jgi:hypothetical protein
MAFGLAGFAYLAQKSVLSGDPEIDFKYLWFAGKLWNAGINPYSEEFVRQGAALFEHTHALQGWLYPPSWWALSAGLAVFDLETAVLVWRSLGALLVLAGTWLLVEAARPALAVSRVAAAGLVLGYTACMQATPMALALGQTSLLVYFGAACLAFGMLRERRAFVVAGLAVLLLKPQVGVIAVAVLAASPARRIAVAQALALSALLAVPAFWIAGVVPTVSGYARELALHASLEVNAPPNTTGIRHLAFDVFGADLSAAAASALGLAVALGVSLALGRTAARPALVLTIAGVLALAPLHEYDLVLAAPLVAVCLSTEIPDALRWVFAAGLLVVFRSANLATALGWSDGTLPYFPGSHLVSLAGVAMFAAQVASLAWRRLR